MNFPKDEDKQKWQMLYHHETSTIQCRGESRLQTGSWSLELSLQTTVEKGGLPTGSGADYSYFSLKKKLDLSC